MRTVAGVRSPQKSSSLAERRVVHGRARASVTAAAPPRDGTAVDEPLSAAHLFDAHAVYVGRTLRCLGVRDGELPDVVQEVFLLAHHRRAELSDPAKIRAWLYAICVRKALSARRDGARRQLREVARSAEPASERTPHDELEKTRRLTQALCILGELDDDRRAVFVLSEVEQLPMVEVAVIVGCPLQTAYSRLQSARREIATTLRRLRARGTIE